MRVTHLVLCTPGRAGTITRAGKPWSAQIRAVDPQRQQGISHLHLAGGQRRRAETAAALQRLDEQAGVRRGANHGGEVGQPHPGPGLHAGGPALHAGDRQPRGVLWQGE